MKANCATVSTMSGTIGIFEDRKEKLYPEFQKSQTFNFKP